MLFGSTEGVAPGTRVISEQSAPSVPMSDALLGRVINGLGRPLDGRPARLRRLGCARASPVPHRLAPTAP